MADFPGKEQLNQQTLPIGVFDSGSGGISVLARVYRLLPHEDFVYYADAARFPYGGRSSAEVREGVFQAAEAMVKHGVKMMVVACNTATAAAIRELREQLSIPVLGIEPALKPAAEKQNAGSIAVLATELTLKEEKYRRLFEEYGGNSDVTGLPAAGLADLVEEGLYRSCRAEEYLTGLLGGRSFDTVVLGCTHYPFLLPVLRKLLPGADFIDGGEGLARNIVHTLEETHLLNSSGSGKIEVMSSDNAYKARFRTFFEDIMIILADEEKRAVKG